MLTLECLLGGDGVFDRKAEEDTGAGCNEPLKWKEDEEEEGEEKFPTPVIADPECGAVPLVDEEE